MKVNLKETLFMSSIVIVSLIKKAIMINDLIYIFHLYDDS